MWTLGYNDVEEFSIPESFDGRKLRPLIPRPMPSLSPNGSNFCAQYYHLGFMNEQSKRELNGTPPVVVSSSRWNPTSEQLRILEELYRRGTRTPSAEQIQHITAQLRRFGKIEGKNVFYWFQNHKARERQKRRRQTAESAADDNDNDNDHPRDIKPLQKKISEAAGRSVWYEIEETKKNWTLSKNCSTSLAEESVKIQRVALAAPDAVEEEIILLQKQQRRDYVERNTTWHTINQLINPRREITKLITKTQHVNALIKPYGENDEDEDEDGCEESQTLELFPLHSDKSYEFDKADDKGLERSISNMKSPTCTPNFQFYEFLPLKN